MLVSIDLLWCTQEADGAVRQTVERMHVALTAMAVADPPFLNISQLAIGLAASHPLGSWDRRKPSGSYKRPTGVFYASASLDYMAWTSDDWSLRVAAVAAALGAAVGAVHKTRLSATERVRLRELIHTAAEQVARDPPPNLMDLNPVYLMDTQDGARPAVSFGRRPPVEPPNVQVRALFARDLAAYLAERPPPPTAPEMVKLYRRSGDAIEYREAWPDGEAIIEHWGRCGERGETRSYPSTGPEDAANILRRLKTAARGLGFQPIPPSRHVGLLVERSIDGFGGAADLEERHRLEDFLTDLLGWSGLGHCDGGSTGSGSMEASCLVVDYPLAATVITAALSGSPFSAFTVRRQPT